MEDCSANCIGPYEVIEQFNTIVYRLDLFVELKHVCNMLHISYGYPSTYQKNATVSTSGGARELV